MANNNDNNLPASVAECSGHWEDNQGCCHECGILMNRYLWELYAGEGAPHGSDNDANATDATETGKAKPFDLLADD